MTYLRNSQLLSHQELKEIIKATETVVKELQKDSILGDHSEFLSAIKTICFHSSFLFVLRKTSYHTPDIVFILDEDYEIMFGSTRLDIVKWIKDLEINTLFIKLNLECRSLIESTDNSLYLL